MKVNKIFSRSSVGFITRQENCNYNLFNIITVIYCICNFNVSNWKSEKSPRYLQNYENYLFWYPSYIDFLILNIFSIRFEFNDLNSSYV